MSDASPAEGAPAFGTEPSDGADIRFPDPSCEDVAALRRARRQPMDPEQIWQLLKSMERPTMEELIDRPITQGEPFRWGRD